MYRDVQQVYRVVRLDRVFENTFFFNSLLQWSANAMHLIISCKLEW